MKMTSSNQSYRLTSQEPTKMKTELTELKRKEKKNKKRKEQLQEAVQWTGIELPHQKTMCKQLFQQSLHLKITKIHIKDQDHLLQDPIPKTDSKLTLHQKLTTSQTATLIKRLARTKSSNSNHQNLTNRKTMITNHTDTTLLTEKTKEEDLPTEITGNTNKGTLHKKGPQPLTTGITTAGTDHIPTKGLNPQEDIPQKGQTTTTTRAMIKEIADTLSIQETTQGM